MDSQQLIVNTTNEQQPKEKYLLEKVIEEKADLQIFFMALISDMVPPPNLARLFGIVAYRHNDALQKAQSMYMGQGGMVISKGDSEKVKNLLQNVNLEEYAKPGVVVEPIIVPESKMMSVERFKASLIMATAEYIKDPKDQAELRRIIQTINVTEKI